MLLGLALCLLRGRLYEPAIAETPGRNGFAEPSQEVGVIRRGIVLKPPCAVPRDKSRTHSSPSVSKRANMQSSAIPITAKTTTAAVRRLLRRRAMGLRCRHLVRTPRPVLVVATRSLGLGDGHHAPTVTAGTVH
jgi:hypothetical protein